MNDSSDFVLHTLPNGLRVVIRALPNNPMVAVNMMYQVGSRNTEGAHTGLAHLVEHLMCGGSQHIPNYDDVLQEAGAQSNAYTSFDVTNYWSLLPKTHLARALWVESERMFYPHLPEELLKTQQRVVTEEFKQVALAKPYGDLLHHLLPQVYKVHPYQTPIIGKVLKDIQAMRREDIETFIAKYYHPKNAVLSIVGGVDPEATLEKVKAWFNIEPKRPFTPPQIPQEPPQEIQRRQVVRGKVPQDALYMAYPMSAYKEARHMKTRLLSYYLAEGKSAWLYHHLVEEQGLFTQLHGYTFDTMDPGIFLIEGKVTPGVTLAKAEEAVQALCLQIDHHPTWVKAFEKSKHQIEAHYCFEQVEITQQAEDLAWGTLLGDPAWLAKEITHLQQISPEELLEEAKMLFDPKKATIIHYQKDH